jgi:hypothetical protein
MSTPARTFLEGDAPNIARIGEVVSSGFMSAAVLMVLKGGRGCGGCSGRRRATGSIAQLMGPGLSKMATEAPDRLYTALSRVYGIRGPIEIHIGCCHAKLQEPKNGQGNKAKVAH